MKMQTIVPSYFGKIPSRDDFVNSGNADHALVRHVDRWLVSCMSELARVDGWQRIYDTSLPFDFLAASTDNGSLVCGHVACGQDRSGRRSPLLGTLRIEPRTPMAFLTIAPLAFDTTWQALATAVNLTLGLPRADASALPPGEPCSVPSSSRSLRALADEYLASEGLSALDAALSTAGYHHGVAMTTRALRGALGTVLRQPEVRIDRGLILPLPTDPLRRSRVASFWLDLILGALGQRDVELVALLTRGSRPRLIVSFDGSRGSELVAAWMPDDARARYVDLTRLQRDGSESRFGIADTATLAALREAFLYSIKEAGPCAA